MEEFESFINGLFARCDMCERKFPFGKLIERKGPDGNTLYLCGSCNYKEELKAKGKRPFLAGTGYEEE